MKRRLSLSGAVLLTLCACTPPPAPVYGLRPEYPEVRRHGKEVLFISVDSTRPMLRWQAFDPPEGASWVVYDLKVYVSENDSPGRLLLENGDNPLPRYQFQNDLAPCAKYFWSVRARFRIEGREQATEWGVVQLPGRERWSPVVPDPAYYRFVTPCR